MATLIWQSIFQIPLFTKKKQTGMVIHDWSVFIDGDDGRPVSFHFYFLFVCLRCKIDGNRNEAGRGDLRKPPPARRRRNRRICRTEVSYRKVRKLSNHYLLLFSLVLRTTKKKQTGEFNSNSVIAVTARTDLRETE